MALNVQWNWRMPTVGDPNGPANANLAGLQQGAKNFADSLIKSKEREQNQQQFDAKLAQAQQQFADELQLKREQMGQEARFKNRDYWETVRMNNAKLDQMEQDLERKKKQDEYLNKMYEQYFADADQQELAQLLAKYQGKNDATNVMAGLNPQFLNLR